MPKLQSEDGPEADRGLGTPGADQNPITSVINLLIRALIAVRWNTESGRLLQGDLIYF